MQAIKTVIEKGPKLFLKFHVILSILITFTTILDSNSEYINDHFQPAWYYCDVCRLKLDFLGKVETRYEDMLYLKLAR